MGDEDAEEDAEEKIDPESIEGPLTVSQDGEVKDKAGKVVGKLIEGDAKKLSKNKNIQSVDKDGNLLGKDGKPVGKIELASVGDEEEKPDLSLLEGKKVTKAGMVVDENGNAIGRLVEGDAKKLVGKACDAEGRLWNDSGKVIGRAELLPEDERKENVIQPFEDFPDAIVQKDGSVIYNGQIVGKLVEGDPKKLEGKKVDADGEITDKNGNLLGRAERYEEPEPEPEPEQEVDLSELAGKKVNKAGMVVDDNGNAIGRLVEGDPKQLAGRTCDAKGQLWNDSGKVIGRAELLPEEERKKNVSQPFEDFPDAIVQKDGSVIYDGQIVGKVVEGDPKKLQGKKVDPDGDIVDKNGNTLGHAERYDEPEPEPEKEIDMSELAGKKVNKAGNIVDDRGLIYGRLVEGDPKKLVGHRCDGKGNVWNDAGEIVGKAELIPANEREGQKEGPFSGFSGAKVDKSGKVLNSSGEVIGRVIQGDPKQLAGHEVDEDGDILDKNGNPIGKAERWEEEEKPKEHNPLAGRKVNREGNVVDENGDVIGKLTEGELSKCVGKEIDEDGDIVDSKGQTIGHATILSEIPPEPEPEPEEEEKEPEKTPEELEKERQEKEKAEQEQKDRELAKKMCYIIEQTMDKIQPILDQITEVCITLRI